jgi:prepilin-type processing-associated H-X9-DG protein
LVVIAIIAILAAMLFPVFARARESARKIQCLSNVKNVALAVQMYLNDYDKLPPHAAPGADENAFWQSIPGGNPDKEDCGGWGEMWGANPYLRWQVVLDEYVRNRDVWRCPSAKFADYATPSFIVPNYGGVWWHYLQAHVGEWGDDTDAGGPCSGGGAYPTGWGGTITDSVRQQARASLDTGAFESTVSYSNQWLDLKTSQVNDPAMFMVVGDSCMNPYIWTAGSAFYEYCGADPTSWNAAEGIGCYTCEVADWVNCSWTQDCGVPYGGMQRWLSDASWRSQHTRHMGGSNLGFMDGHASWWPADQAMSKVPYCEPCSSQTSGSGPFIHYKDRPLIGFCPVTSGVAHD